MSGVGRPGRNSRQKKAREGGLDGDRQGPWLKPGRSSICESVQLFCEPTPFGHSRSQLSVSAEGGAVLRGFSGVAQYQ